MSACICDATINRECVYHGILHAPARTTLRRLWPIKAEPRASWSPVEHSRSVAELEAEIVTLRARIAELESGKCNCGCVYCETGKHHKCWKSCGRGTGKL